MPQKPMVRKKQKARRSKQLADWRAKNEKEQQPPQNDKPAKKQ